MTPTEATLKRIDDVLEQNRRTENLFITGTILLFLAGIACIASALLTGDYLWSAPSVVTTGLLHYPLKSIRAIRQKNIALATVPVLIGQLPSQKAAGEIQKLIERLYED